MNPAPEGHVLRPATPWSRAYTVPVPIKKVEDKVGVLAGGTGKHLNQLLLPE